MTIEEIAHSFVAAALDMTIYPFIQKPSQEEVTAMSYPTSVSSDEDPDLVPCPISSLCPRVPRASVAQHVILQCPYRRVECIYEGCSAEFVVLEREAHEAVCPGRQTECPHGCGLLLRAGELPSHSPLCPCLPRRCPYAFAGCTSGPIPQGDFEEHLAMRMQEHMSLLATQVEQLQRRSDATEQRWQHVAKSEMAEATAVVVSTVSAKLRDLTFFHLVLAFILFVVWRMLPLWIAMPLVAFQGKRFYKRSLVPVCRNQGQRMHVVLVFTMLCGVLLWIATSIW